MAAAVPEQAVILAAGRGERLRPITDHTPKALMPFFGVPLLDWAAARLVQAGVRRIAVNLHHHAGVVRRHVEEVLARRHAGVDWHCSPEEELLGTGGALARLRPWLRDEPFWIVNADVLLADRLRPVAEAHAADRRDATWLVAPPPAHGRERAVLRDRSGRVQGLAEPDASPEPDEGRVFTGIHLAEPGLLAYLPEEPCCVIRRGYLRWLADGARIGSHDVERFWADTGTPERYVAVHRLGWAHMDAWRELGLLDDPSGGTAEDAGDARGGGPGP